MGAKFFNPEVIFNETHTSMGAIFQDPPIVVNVCSRKADLRQQTHGKWEHCDIRYQWSFTTLPWKVPRQTYRCSDNDASIQLFFRILSGSGAIQASGGTFECVYISQVLKRLMPNRKQLPNVRLSPRDERSDPVIRVVKS
jgi:hypothetical protein